MAIMLESEVKNSKYLSKILRHDPGSVGIVLDKNGWALVDDILSKMNLSMSSLDSVVKNNNKQRFEFNEDKTKIRARQGHSINVDLELEEKKPPALLYHGTVDRFLGDIKINGLKKMGRQHVHLSADKETAIKVGARRGKPIVLVVYALHMHRYGFKFYQSNNGVWLTDSVPPSFLENI